MSNSPPGLEGMSEQEIAAALAQLQGLGGIEGRSQLVQEQLARAEALSSQPAENYGPGWGGVLGGIGHIFKKIRQRSEREQLAGEQQKLTKQTAAGRTAGAKLAGQQEPFDLSGYLGAEDDATAQQQSAALAKALSRQRQTATALQASGDKVLGGLGQNMMGDVGRREGYLAEAGEKRLSLALKRREAEAKAAADKTDAEARNLKFEDERAYKKKQLDLESRKLEQANWGAVADPVTGGIVLYNHKTKEVRPLGPGGGKPGDPNALKAPGGKPTETQRNNQLASMESVAQLNAAIELLKKNPGAYGGTANFVAGLAEKVAPGFAAPVVQSISARRLSPGELSTKNQVTNVISGVINKRAGSSVTLSEELRQKFLPTEMDGLEQTMQKLEDLRAYEIRAHKAASGESVPLTGASEPSAPSSVEQRAKSYYDD